jgi:iron complex transport system substrate-binding protein
MKKMCSLLLGLALFAGACGDDGETTEAAEPTVERIVSLSPTATEILFAIGAGDQVVAVDQFSNYPAEAPLSDLDGFQVNVEAVAAYEPQVVVMQSNEASTALEALGITVIVQDSPADFEGIYAQIEALGAATENETGAAQLVAEMQTDIDNLLADAPDASGLSYYHELGTDYYSLNSDAFVAQVYGLFGMVSIGDDAAGEAFAGYLPLSEEYILESDPEFIFLADTIWAEQTAETVAARPGWGDLTAVKTGAVVELDDDVASRWGPRVVEFAEAIADVLAEVAVPA